MFSRKKQQKLDKYVSGTQEQILQRKENIGEKLSFGASEAYKLLRTNLMFSMPDDEQCKIIGVTSSLRGEGKSTTSMNLAYTLAEAGKKTLLIEADMRIPVLAETLDLKTTPGLSNVLAGLNDLEEALRYEVLKKQLCVLPAGEIPPNPSELLSSKRMEQLIEALSNIFEYIIIDLPPLNAVSDGLALAKILTGMVMVVRQDYCDQNALATSMRQMKFLQVKVLGFVMTHARTSDKHYYKRN